jgi:hypothetical protein
MSKVESIFHLLCYKESSNLACHARQGRGDP